MEIKPTAVIGEGVNFIDKKSVIIKSGVILGRWVTIGANCFIGPGAILLHGLPDGSSKPCIIGNGVFIGAGAIINPDVFVCDNAIIGSGSVVTKSITEAGVYAGNPARRIK